MVEKWLLKVQQLMIQSMIDITGQSVNNYDSETRASWILSWPGQIVQCVDCIMWTSEVTQAIISASLKELIAKCTDQIEECVQLVQGKLEPGSQITIEALIVIDVHGRDIVRKLHSLRVSSVADFNWIAQMRYYWNKVDVSVSMITTTIAYGFEYLGNTGRLVSTPLTDRCYR